MSRLSIILCLALVGASIAAPPQKNAGRQSRRVQNSMLQHWKESAISEYHDLHEQIMRSQKLISKLSESATTIAASFELSVYDKIQEIKNGFEDKLKEAHDHVSTFKATHDEGEGLDDTECQELESVASNMAIEGLNNGTECIFQVSIQGANYVEGLKKNVQEIRTALDALDKEAYECIDNIYDPNVKFTDVSKKRFCLKKVKNQEHEISAERYALFEKEVAQFKELIATLDPALIQCTAKHSAYSIRHDIEDIVNAINICYTGVYESSS